MRHVLLALTIVLAAPALADDTIDCENAMAQQNMNQCAGMEFEKADAALNAVWKLAKAEAERMDAEQPDMKGAAESLLAAQRGWIAYRDGTCELAGWEARGGSMEPMLASGCLAEETRKRTKQLQEFIGGPAQ